MLISRNSFLFRWVYLPRLLMKGADSLPTRVNLCPFFWQMMFSPITNLILFPIWAFACVVATIVLWTVAISLGKYIDYSETHWEESRGRYMKNHFLWDCLTKYAEKGSYRDSFIWKMEPIPWLPNAFGFRLNFVFYCSVLVVLYAQYWGWLNVHFGTWPWELLPLHGITEFLLTGVWVVTTGIGLVIAFVFCFALVIQFSVTHVIREFVLAKKNRWCPEIEIV